MTSDDQNETQITKTVSYKSILAILNTYTMYYLNSMLDILLQYF